MATMMEKRSKAADRIGTIKKNSICNNSLLIYLNKTPIMKVKTGMVF